MIEISTERLTIKKLSALDKARLIVLIGNLRASETLSNLPYPYTDEDAEHWIGIVQSSEFNLNIFHDGLLIGGIGLTPKVMAVVNSGIGLGLNIEVRSTQPRRVTRCSVMQAQRHASGNVERMFTRVIWLLPTFLKKLGLSK